MAPLGDPLVVAERAGLLQQPSTRVVLPWSTWAMMAMLRSFMGERVKGAGRRCPKELEGT